MFGLFDLLAATLSLFQKQTSGKDNVLPFQHNQMKKRGQVILWSLKGEGLFQIKVSTFILSLDLCGCLLMRN